MPPSVRASEAESTELPAHWRLPTLVEVLRRSAEEAPEQTAFSYLVDGEAESVSLTNTELDRRARRIAAGLQDRGIGDGQRVLIALDPGLDYVATLFGCFYAGAVATPVYPPDPYRLATTLERLQAIYAGADCGLVLSNDMILGGPTSGLRQLAPAATVSVEEFLSQEDAESCWRPPPSDPQRLAVLQYTSGTTSTPRGVTITFANLNHNLRAIAPLLDVDDAVGVHWLPPYHDMGLIGGVLLPVFARRHTYLMSPVSFMQRPARWLQAISRLGGTSTASPNFGYELCLRKVGDEDLEGLDLSRWRIAVSGAEPVRADTIDRFTERFEPYGFRRETFCPAYGMAETTLMVSLSRFGVPPTAQDFDGEALADGKVVPLPLQENRASARRLVGCGPPGMGVDVRIIEPESPNNAGIETGGVGEVWVRSDGVAQGYWQNPVATASSFGARLQSGEEGFLRTGDLGFLHDGELYVTGRRKELIILAGRNYFPHDIELAVQGSHAALKRDGGAAVALEVDREERVVVFQEVLRPKRHDLAELAELARRAVVGHTLNEPHAVVLLPVGELPKTSSGKTRRAECLRAWQAGQLRVLLELGRGEVSGVGDDPARSREPGCPRPRPAREAPHTETEKWLAQVWRESLNVNEVSPGDDFFALGGQSLQVVQMLSAVAERTGITMSLKALFDAPTLGAFAATVDQASSSTAPSESLRHATDEELQAEHPLSASQQRFWLMDQFGLAGGANVPLAVRLSGPINRERLQRALDQLVARHDALRIEINESMGVARQRFVNSACLKLEELLAPIEPINDPVAWALNQPFVWRPFDMTHAPIARAALVSLDEKAHVLLLVLHHAIGDGASFAALVEDLAALYRGEAPPPVEWSFADYLVNRDDKPTGEAAASYWRNRLADLPPAIDLPFDRPTKATTLAEIKTTDYSLDRSTIERVAAAAATNGVTPFMLYLTVWRTLLSRYTADEKLGVGVAVAGRESPAWRRTVGCFINTLPLAADTPAGAIGFDRLLSGVRDQTLSDLERAATPWETILDAADAQRIAGRMPMVQCFLLYDDQGPLAASAESLRQWGECELTAAATDYRGLGVYDATLVVETSGSIPRLRLIHDHRLISTTAAERMLASLAACLAAIADKPTTTVDALPIPSEAERATAVLEGPRVELSAHADPLAMFLTQVETRPNEAAIVCGESQATCRELALKSQSVCEALTKQGVQGGDRVGLLVSRSIDAVAAMLGVWRAGAAYVPLDPSYPPARLEHMATDAELACLIVDDQSESVALNCDAPVLTLESICRSDTALQQSTFLQGPLAYVIYTSGSTGKPKGVMVPRRAVTNLLQSFAREVDFQPGDTMLAATTFSFDISVLELFLPLACGGAVLLANSETVGEPTRLAGLIDNAKPRFLQGTPSTFRMLLGEGWRPDSEQGVLCGGEPLTTDVARSLREATDRLWNVYGPTETTIWSTANRIDDPNEASIIGRSIANTTCVVLGRDRTLAPVGVWGELAIGGDGLADGYWRRDELTEERFVTLPAVTPSRFYLTGDTVCLREDGRLEFRGRNDQQVKVRGHRIELREVESALVEHPAIAEAAAVVHVDQQGLASLVSYFTPAGCEQVAPAELRQWLGRTLPAYMIPSAFVPMTELPRTDNGKLDRKRLAEIDGAPRARSRDLTPPRTPIEEKLAEWWCEVLRIEQVGVEESFFEIGGHSLLAMQVMVRVRDELGVELPLREVYDRPTIAAWAEMIVAAQMAAMGEDEAERLLALLEETEGDSK